MEAAEVRNRFEKVLVGSDPDVLNYISDKELRDIGDMIEKLGLNEISSTRERIEVVLEELKDGEEPKISKTQLAGIIGRSTKSVQSHTPREWDDEIWAGRNGNQERVYAHRDAVTVPKTKNKQEKELRESIIESHQRAEDILGGYRQPSLEETAYTGGFDSKEEEIRKAFFELKQRQNWTEPSEKIIEDWKEELPELIGYATIILKLEDLEPKEVPGEEIYSSEKYAEKNKELIEEIEIKERKVGYDLRLPMKLVMFTDQRIINIQPTGDELEDRKYIVR